MLRHDAIRGQPDPRWCNHLSKKRVHLLGLLYHWFRNDHLIDRRVDGLLFSFHNHRIFGRSPHVNGLRLHRYADSCIRKRPDYMELQQIN